MRPHRIILSCLLLLLPALAAAQPVAEIVSLKGRGEYSNSPTSGWTPAKLRQKVEAGQWLRTLQDGRMALLMADQTNATIDANSTLQLKAPDATPAKRSIVDFQKGKGRFETKTPSRAVAITTPTGLAAIRGTEWLVEVADDGTSAFTVVEGEIEISNELGTLSVGADEQGILEKGKPPSKRRVQNARERVQWVSDFAIEPRHYPELRSGAAADRYAPAVAAIEKGEIEAARTSLAAMADRDESPAAMLLLADIALYRGDSAAALEWLQRARARFPKDARIPGLMARAHLFADDMERARAAASEALQKYPDSLESQLHAGEVARLDGDARGALAAFRRATRIAPQDPRGWLALGRVHSERSDPRRARPALDRAFSLAPRDAAILGERGLLEANSYDLPLARRTLDAAVALAPDDFSTWTGLGVARLKSGDVAGALEALRKATLLQPGYARAHVYLAVVYWQQGRAEDALGELRTASVHDPRDPLPYQFASMIHSDLLRVGEAMRAAQEALARTQYTKSLDVVASNLRGGGNLGGPLAQFGLESWALKNAQDSYDPFWAGSHLFLADRLAGRFMMNSEFYQGFLVDPLAFGAPNRFQPLVSRTGHYGAIAWRAARDSRATLSEPALTANGLALDGSFAYFLDASILASRAKDGSAEDRAPSYTAAIGLRPRDHIGLFVFHNRLEVDTRTGYQGRSLFDTYQRTKGPARRTDAGIMYRHSPDTQLWIKGGAGSEDARQESRDVTQIGTFRSYRDNEFTTQPRRADVMGRALHRMANGLELSATAERATFRSVDFLERDAFGRTTAAGTRLLESVRQQISDESRSIELAARTPPHRTFVAELQVDHSTYEKRNDILVRRDFAQQLVGLRDDYDRERTSPRAGFAWHAGSALTVRGAYQEWLRQASIGSLRSVSTAGIILDHRYVLPGGTLKRGRLQAELQLANTVLLTAFADRQEFDNLRSTLVGVVGRPDSSNLDRLRNRNFNVLATLDRQEGDAIVSAGEFDESGLSVNWLATRHLAVYADAIWAKGENTGLQAGNALPFLPRRRAVIGATCYLDQRISIAAMAHYRTERFLDEANRAHRPQEWSGTVQAYWESRSKHWSLELIVTNIGSKSEDDSVGLAVTYRF